MSTFFWLTRRARFSAPPRLRERCERYIAIARELVATVRKKVTIDWTLRENVRAQLRASAGGAGGAEQAPT